MDKNPHIVSVQLVKQHIYSIALDGQICVLVLYEQVISLTFFEIISFICSMISLTSNVATILQVMQRNFGVLLGN